MTSRRRQPRNDRVRKRLQVRFGTEPALKSGGFTTNLSSTGVGVSAPVVFPVGTRLTLRLSLPYERSCEITGTVAWSLVGAASMGMHGQMGIRIELRDANYDGLLASMGLLTATDRAAATASTSVATSETRARITAPPSSTATRRAARTARLPRFGARFPTHFGDAGVLALEGLSVDLSSSGLSLVSRFVAPAGSDVAVLIELPDGEEAHLVGQVMWARVRPLVPGLPNGMGVRLISANSNYLRFVRGLARRSMLVDTSPDELMSSL